MQTRLDDVAEFLRNEGSHEALVPNIDYLNKGVFALPAMRSHE